MSEIVWPILEEKRLTIDFRVGGSEASNETERDLLVAQMKKRFEDYRSTVGSSQLEVTSVTEDE